MPEQQVIALIAVFRPDQKLLLLQRRPEQRLSGLWTFPGGKVEEGEQPLQAAVRELYEETGIRGKRWRHLGKAFEDTGENLYLHFLLFVCNTITQEPPQPESPYQWSHRESLNNLPMPAINQRFITMLQMPEVDDYLNSYALIHQCDFSPTFF
jgi:mutator protein MutT